MEIKGYKAFNLDHTNRYGMPFEEGKDYHVDGKIKFGNNGNGFHMCTHLSDVFRYFDPEYIDVASVIGSGEYDEGEDETWSEPYYDMYAVSDIHIEKFLTRDEIIDIISKSSSSDIVKFFATFKPTKKEGMQILFGNREQYNHDKAVSAYLYYLEGVNVYAFSSEEKGRILKKVLNDGQDSNQRSKGK